jgi:menaquinone-dependent protoporphyrinogen IX oxidase
VNIGIIVYSRTGHTLSVARKLEESLTKNGHHVTLKELETVGGVDLSATTAALKNKPPIGPYDALVLGSPVNGGRMSAPMHSYLDQVGSLEGKRIAFLLTHFFPRAWGTNQTIEQMTEVCESKGAAICGSGDVRWPSLRRRRQISRAVDNLTTCLES